MSNNSSDLNMYEMLRMVEDEADGPRHYFDMIIRESKSWDRVDSADKRDDIYWTMDFAELQRDSGEKTNCLDDSYVRNAFEIRISEQTQTSATVDIFSKDPDRHNWFDIYKGTAEVWQLDSNNNWKLYESKTYILTGSPFDGNYW